MRLLGTLRALQMQRRMEASMAHAAAIAEHASDILECAEARCRLRQAFAAQVCMAHPGFRPTLRRQAATPSTPCSAP